MPDDMPTAFQWNRAFNVVAGDYLQLHALCVGAYEASRQKDERKALRETRALLARLVSRPLQIDGPGLYPAKTEVPMSDDLRLAGFTRADVTVVEYPFSVQLNDGDEAPNAG